MSDKTTNKKNKRLKKREFRKKCEDCGTMTKAYRVFDIDGKNLVECLVCLNCRTGAPPIK